LTDIKPKIKNILSQIKADCRYNGELSSWINENQLDHATNRLIDLFASQLQSTIEDYEEVLADKKRLVKELDVILNGSNGAENPSLCDLVSQIQTDFANKKQEPEEGDFVSGSWLDSITSKTYFTEGVVKRFPAGLFVEQLDGTGITPLNDFFHFSKITKPTIK
ncbi:MAG: hypothetical protein AABY22_23945, partial [Nanoarchaeota archaeon]